MLTFKNGFRWLVVMIGVLLLLSCAPSEMPEQEQETDDKQEPFIDLTPIDPSLYNEDDDNHYRYGRDCFLNLPGMVMFGDQDFYFSGSGICFANKTSKVASIYCFDPLCEHDLGYCSARFFWRICDAVYQKTDNMIYCLRTGVDLLMCSDGNLYAFSLDTQDYKVVFEGNGTELQHLQVQNWCVYFARMNEEAYLDWFRYDVSTKRTELLGLECERRMIDLFIRYEQIFVMFDGDKELYLTDENFSFFEATGLNVGQDKYIRHGKCYIKEKTDDEGTVDLYEYDIATKQKRLIVSGYENYGRCETVTAEYLYFTNSDKSKLSRCRIEDGQLELLYDFSIIHESAQLRGIKVYDGELYVSYQMEDRRSPVGKANHYGNLVKEGNGWTFVDFEQGRVLSNLDPSDYQGGFNELENSKNHSCIASVCMLGWMYARCK